MIVTNKGKQQSKFILGGDMAKKRKKAAKKVAKKATKKKAAKKTSRKKK